MFQENDYSPDAEAENFSFPDSIQPAIKPNLAPEAEEPAPAPPQESRFGPKDHILELMRSCPEEEIHLLGNIREHIADIPEHTNIVELASLELPREAANSKNEAEHYIIEHDGEKVLCIFKPFDGENKRRKSDLGVRRFYPHEAAAFALSEALELDLVPPTVIRTINGREGALQFFVDHNRYAMYDTCTEKIGMEQSEYLILEQSKDYRNMALFDFILANTDRHNFNWMMKTEVNDSQARKVSLDHETPPSLVGIDHGETFLAYNYRIDKVEGPSRILTEEPPMEGMTGEESDNTPPRDVYLNIDEITTLENAIANQKEISNTLHEIGIHPAEIVFMWQRVHFLLKEEVFISKKNRSQVELPTATYASILKNNLDYFLPNPKFPEHEITYQLHQDARDHLADVDDKSYQTYLDWNKDPNNRGKKVDQTLGKSIMFVRALRHPQLNSV